ncbi:uncharacterized protein FOMMEDRAFT_164727 [Fomitiporia mediterranea MF3/22]|uniref:uncharacterized protein n=1 Tax=Fomitiporia mediterranea (strain MF3/22) TaxID=694068 RepID=UPI00044089C5|nr:uncharacterized protein FOMMEDRAFT_164727 [Fomitiporia mediterranea MF3/22]EJD07889.1 hypothetical protein FOMMEDRAFT_164727 [Fomitiporia mediterranea MF3/22]
MQCRFSVPRPGCVLAYYFPSPAHSSLKHSPMKMIFRRLPKEYSSESSSTTATSDKPAAKQSRKGFGQKVNNLTRRIKRRLSRRSESSSLGVIQSAQEGPTSSTINQVPEAASDAVAKDEHDENRVSAGSPVKHKKLEKAKKVLKVTASALILVAEAVSAIGDICPPAKAAAGGLLHVDSVVRLETLRR